MGKLLVIVCTFLLPQISGVLPGINDSNNGQYRSDEQPFQISARRGGGGGGRRSSGSSGSSRRSSGGSGRKSSWGYGGAAVVGGAAAGAVAADAISPPKNVLMTKTEHPAKLIKILSGDSMLMSVNGREYTVNLYGVRPPEKEQQRSIAALQEMLANSELSVFPLTSDESGTLALLSAGDVSVNSAMIAGGHAKLSSVCSLSFCNKWRIAEQEAQKEKRGIWATE